VAYFPKGWEVELPRASMPSTLASGHLPTTSLALAALASSRLFKAIFSKCGSVVEAEKVLNPREITGCTYLQLMMRNDGPGLVN
jgi:hypothetical protein